jgi:hypothetical protein
VQSHAFNGQFVFPSTDVVKLREPRSAHGPSAALGASHPFNISKTRTVQIGRLPTNISNLLLTLLSFPYLSD